MPLQRLDFVHITGLQSAAGQKLNGAKGVVLDDATCDDGTQVRRYPVLIYEIGNRKILSWQEQPKKKIKAENLRPFQSSEYNQSLDDFIVRFINQSDVVHPADPILEQFKAQALWCEIAHALEPGSVIKALKYATILLDIANFDNKYKLGEELPASKRELNRKALDIVSKYMDQVSPTDEHYYRYLHTFCMTFCKAEERLEEAMELALKIPPDFLAEGRNASRDCLDMLAVTCQELCERDVHPVQRPEVRDVYVRVCQVCLDRDPTDPENTNNLALALFHAKHHEEVIRLCHQATTQFSRQLSQDERDQYNLMRSIAQLHLPGMPLADYKVISYNADRTVLTCLHKNQFDRGQIVGVKNPITGLTHNTFLAMDGHSPDNPVNLIKYNVPRDPDDPEQWPPELFEMTATIFKS